MVVTIKINIKIKIKFILIIIKYNPVFKCFFNLFLPF